MQHDEGAKRFQGTARGRRGAPTIVAGGVVVAESSASESRRGGFAGRRRVGKLAPGLGGLAGALLFGAAFLAAVLGAGLLGSCSGTMAAELGAAGGAELSISADIPPTLAQKLRRLSSLPENAPLFDLKAVRSSLAERPGISIRNLSAPSPESLRASLSLRDLAAVLADPELAQSGILRLSERNGVNSLAFRLDKGQGAEAASLFPGLDPYLVDALAPPAFEEEPITREEYRTMLASIFGERLMPALDAAAISLSITAPGTVTASTGGKLVGRTLAVSLPLIDLLVLEKPIEISLSWKR